MAVGNQYFGSPVIQTQSGTVRTSDLPNVATAYIQMQLPPEDPWGYIIALDTLASVYPPPSPDVEEMTVYFMSMQGVPFSMHYYAFFVDMYGDLRPGTRVLASFMYNEAQEEWSLVYVMDIETAYNS